MYFYEIEVYYPFYENDKIVMGHDECFDNHQLNVIVQEAFDECIETYCDKPLLDEGEEACRMKVETIFKEYLPLQLKNRGFWSIKIDETCSIMDGVVFCKNGLNNPVLRDRYKDKILPPCKKCMRGTYIGETYIGYDGKCDVPNTRKDTSLPTTRVIKTIPLDLNEKEKDSNDIEGDSNNDKFNISLLKLYFTNSHKSQTEAIKASEIVDNILENNDFKDYWTEWGEIIDGKHKRDIVCGFDLDTDMKRGKKLLEDYGFVLEDDEDGFWITGVKE